MNVTVEAVVYAGFAVVCDVEIQRVFSEWEREEEDERRGRRLDDSKDIKIERRSDSKEVLLVLALGDLIVRKVVSLGVHIARRVKRLRMNRISFFASHES
jgi:hypothetical protein